MNSVLIVDDDSDILKFYQQVFLNASFEVDAILSIPEAEELIKSKTYNLIILDLMFPGADVLSTIRLAKSKNSQNSSTPLIILTNLPKGEKTAKALEAGANLCLLKSEHTPKSIIEVAQKLIYGTET